MRAAQYEPKKLFLVRNIHVRGQREVLPVVGHVDHLSRGVEPPLEDCGSHGVGDDLARDPHGLVPGHSEHLDLVRLAVRSV